uniref:Cation efflux protein cytoplasmic domain-containing protein n=1 Tax=Amphiprion percula TaxID=161767 RepID=A0A3P8SS64_AMPPE
LCCQDCGPSFFAGMKLLDWCMLGGTVLLLMCEVAVSQLCKSLITLVDGFHTLFLLMHMALPLHQTTIKSLISSLDSSTNTEASTTPDETKHETATLIPAVGAFISALLLASLCTSYLMEIVSFCLDPHPVQRPLLLLVVGAAGLLHKMLVFGLNWDQLQDEKLVGSRQLETESHIQSLNLPPLLLQHSLQPEHTSSPQTVKLLCPGDAADGPTVPAQLWCFSATGQVYRYGLLLLQASPPQICVSDLGRKIASVPGVQAVHDLHIWQLTESLLVASVHVHCYAGLPAHSVGVTCCTVQPEFASCSGFSAEDPSPPPPLACSLACKKACAGNMCCSLLEEETRNLLAPPSGETREEPQTLVIENTFL